MDSSGLWTTPQGRKEVSFIQAKLELLQTQGTVAGSLYVLEVLP